jgi:hypothetical protein
MLPKPNVGAGSLVSGLVDGALVVDDGDARALAFEEAGLAHDAVGSIDDARLLRPELELRRHGRVVDHSRELVSRFHLEDRHRTNITAMGASGAFLVLYLDRNHDVFLPQRENWA